MGQGILLWLLTLVGAYFLIDRLTVKFRFLERRFLVILFFYHSALAVVYYFYALSNPSDSIAYYKKVVINYRGPDWLSFYGTGTTFVEFVGYPLIKFMGLTYESVMVLFSFLGFVGFIYFLVLFKEWIKLKHRVFSIELLTLTFFLPNLHFWSSSFGKGSLIFFGLGLFFFAIGKPAERIISLLLGAYVVYMIRPHIFFVVLVAIVIGYIFSTKGISAVYRLVTLIFAGIVLFYIYDDILKFTGLEDDSIFDPDFSERAIKLTRATSGIDIANYNLAEKLFAFWFRPLFFDAFGVLAYVVSVENLLYLLIFAYLLQPKAVRYLFRANSITKACYLTFFGASVALAQISGNLGLAMRQKSQVMILMLFVILKFLDEQKIGELRAQMRRKARQKRGMESSSKRLEPS
ncbi:MAG: hypothetical protein AB7K37_14770 [Cyclobacteriaceae bacterium]